MSDERGPDTDPEDAADADAHAGPSAPDHADASRGLHLPALYRNAEDNARRSQRRSLFLLLTQLLFAVGASSCGALASFTDAPWPGYIAAGASLVIVLLKMGQRATHVETAWYDARTTAERVKSLAWRYATRADPLGPGLSDTEADALLLEQLGNAAHGRVLLTQGNDPQITFRMRTLRSAPLDERVAAYKQDRIADQIDWYARRARGAQAAAQGWDTAFLVFSSAALLAGILLATTGLNLVGVFGTLAGVAVSWAGGRAYGAQSRAYGQTALDLSVLDEGTTEIESDDELSVFVSTLEATLAGEHERWRSARQ